VIRFLLDRGYFPVPAVLATIGRACVPSSGTRPRTRSEGCASRRESKEEVTGRYLERARRASRSSVCMIGVAQETAMVWRGWRQDARTATRTSSSAAGRCSSTTTNSTCAARRREWRPRVPAGMPGSGPTQQTGEATRSRRLEAHVDGESARQRSGAAALVFPRFGGHLIACAERRRERSSSASTRPRIRRSFGVRRSSWSVARAARSRRSLTSSGSRRSRWRVAPVPGEARGHRLRHGRGLGGFPQ
jgi:hypothetical protein